MLSVLLQSILPIVLLAGIGYLFGRLVTDELPLLNRVTLYILLPVLVFHSLATTPLKGDVLGELVLAVGLFSLIMFLVAEGAGRLAGQQPPLLNSTVLASVFSNSGNYGIPLSQFAFGAIGRTTAVVYVTTHALILYTVGIMIAARGSGRRVTGTFTEVLRVPLIHAALLGYAVQVLDLTPGAGNPGWQLLSWIGEASIPLVLIILGMELSTTAFSGLERTFLPGVLKLVAAPLVGLGVLWGLQFNHPGMAEVFLLECALPSAVVPLLLTIQYTQDVPDTDAAEYYGGTVLTTTLASVLIVPVLISLLKAGVLPL